MTRFLSVLFVLFSVAGANAAFDPSGWTWQRPIEIQGASGFVRLRIPPQVFDESQPALEDLRVVNDLQMIVPHVVHWGRMREVEELTWQPARLLNPSYLPGKHARVVIDFGQAVEKNRILLNLPGENYRRRALLEGSDDSRSWEVVAEDLWLFEAGFQGQHFKVNELKFPPNNFRYLRLTVYNMADDPRRIGIESVKAAFSRKESDKELVPVPVKNTTASVDEDAKQSTVELDLGFRNLPVVSLRIDVGSPYFFRCYELRGRNQTVENVPRKTETAWDAVERKVPWRPIQQGVIYRTQHQEKVTESLTIEPVPASYRYLQFRILNGDNPPLRIDGVKVLRRDTSLVFEVTPGRTYRLIGGNPKALAARYDLAKAVQGVDNLRVPTLDLGPALSIKQEEQLASWSERHTSIIWAVLILAVSVMLVLIIRSMRKMRTSEIR